MLWVNCKKWRSISGMTISEVMISTFIFVAIASLCLMVLMVGSDSWQVNSVKMELQQELRKAMDWMNEDLRQSGSSTITDAVPDGNWYNAITFKTSLGVTGGTIDWSPTAIVFSRGGPDSRQLLRTSGAQQKIIAQDISSLQIRRSSLSPLVIEVALQAQKDTTRGASVSESLTFKVKLRN